MWSSAVLVLNVVSGLSHLSAPPRNFSFSLLATNRKAPDLFPSLATPFSFLFPLLPSNVEKNDDDPGNNVLGCTALGVPGKFGRCPKDQVDNEKRQETQENRGEGREWQRPEEGPFPPMLATAFLSGVNKALPRALHP